MKKFNISTAYIHEGGCYFQLRVTKGKVTELRIWNHEGPLYNLLTSCDGPLKPNQVAIKTYSENEGIFENLVSLGFVQSIDKRVPPAYPNYVLCTLNLEKIKEYSI